MKHLIVLACLIAATAATAHPRSGDCPRSNRHRTPEEVLASHFQNLAMGNYEAERCNYARDAVVISDGGGQVPTVNQEIVVSILDNRTHMVRTLFSITTPCIDINDGTDTYIIRDGRIQAQTAHGFPTFKCGPPPGP